MKLFEAATAIIIGISIYWVIASWLEPSLCLVDIGSNGKVVQTWMDCNDVPEY